MKTPRGAQAPTEIAPPHAVVLEHHLQTLTLPMREWKKRDRVPPVLLLTGRPGIGKRTIARWIAQWMQCKTNGWQSEGSGQTSEDTGFGSLFGEAPTPTPQARAEPLLAPCGTCASCTKYAHGTQIDLIEIASEGETREALKIDQFRELKTRLGYGAHESAYRVVLIPQAETMTLQAANSLLKLLEEPPQGWIFLLTSGDPALLLPTIVSRCQTIRLRPLPPEKLETILRSREVDTTRARLVAGLSEGSLGRAVGLARDEAQTQRQQIFQFLSQPAPLLSPIVDWAAADGLSALLDQLESIAGDLVRATISSREPTFQNADGQAALKRHFEAVNRALGPVRARAFWINRSQELARARQLATTPVNRKILVQDLLLGWMSRDGVAG